MRLQLDTLCRLSGCWITSSRYRSSQTGRRLGVYHKRSLRQHASLRARSSTSSIAARGASRPVEKCLFCSVRATAYGFDDCYYVEFSRHRRAVGCPRLLRLARPFRTSGSCLSLPLRSSFLPSHSGGAPTMRQVTFPSRFRVMVQHTRRSLSLRSDQLPAALPSPRLVAVDPESVFSLVELNELVAFDSL